MRQFKDKSAGTWTIDLNFGTVLRVKAATEGRFNLIDPGAKLADELAQDEGTFWELLWHVIEPQAAERQIDAAKFGELMAANCLHDARRLLFEEWTDFFRQLHRPDSRQHRDARFLPHRPGTTPTVRSCGVGSPLARTG